MGSVAPRARMITRAERRVSSGERRQGGREGGKQGGDARADKMEAKLRRSVSFCLLPEKLNHRLDCFTNKGQTVHPELRRPRTVRSRLAATPR